MFTFTVLFTDTATRSAQHFLITRHKSFGRTTIVRHNIKHVLWRTIAGRVAFYSRPGLKWKEL